MNDIGKTNFLYALRFIFDYEVRKKNFIDSDFYNKLIDKEIKILVSIDISDENCNDNQKLRSKLEGAVASNKNIIFIKLTGAYDKNELLAIPMLSWGSDLSNSIEIKQKGTFSRLDDVFKVYYIDSYVDLKSFFSKNSNKLLKNVESDDEDIIEGINSNIENINNKMSQLSGVINFEKNIKTKYENFEQKKLEISVKSEIAMNGFYSALVPYIKPNESDTLYPTSGEGRKKLLTYSIYNLLADETKDRKINIFLIEEPENNLHKSMQIALSKEFFNSNYYKYLFISTHSPYILYEMDNVNLVRIFNENKISATSHFFNVPIKYQNSRQILNYKLSEALFADIVLLVEGQSEEILFKHILSHVNPQYEVNGGYILSAEGIGFEPYYRILQSLNIKTAFRTDNDVHKLKYKTVYWNAGMNRVNKYIKIFSEYHPKTKEITLTIEENLPDNTIETKKNIYDNNKKTMLEINKTFSFYLANVDLEHDLLRTLFEENINKDSEWCSSACCEYDNETYDEYLEIHEKDGRSWCGNKWCDEDFCSKQISDLQMAKKKNMYEFIKELKKELCKIIYESKNFSVLKEFEQ